MKGIRKAGVGVYDIGAVPTPVLYFSTVYLKTGSGVARRKSGSGRDRLEKQGFGMHSFPQKL